ncbi:nuclear transport factor 2 family protein (plasmid) [Isosphaeraceae bacterium EP7]
MIQNPSQQPAALASEQAIQRLCSTYAHLLDAGRFEEVSELLKDASFTVIDLRAEGKEAIHRQLLNGVQVHEDGTPKTWHVNTNYLIDVDENANAATSTNYFTVFQAHTDFPLQPIVTGKYHDRFVRMNGDWRFVERRVEPRLFGDLKHHVRTSDTKIE